jgi:hypothetical protein
LSLNPIVYGTRGGGGDPYLLYVSLDLDWHFLERFALIHHFDAET